MIIGHERIWQFLIKSIERNRVAHAYLFIGPPQVGKKAVALEFVKLLECNNFKKGGKDFYSCGKCVSCQQIERGIHPDILVVEPERTEKDVAHDRQTISKEIKIEQIRQAQKHLFLSSFFGKKKVVIIDEAQLMNQEAANCLLKTLEEPSKKSILILISASQSRLLPTIISRCQLLRFLPVKKELIEEGLKEFGFKEKLKIERAAKLCCGRPGKAISLCQMPEILRKQEQAIADLKNLFKKDLSEKFKYVQNLSQDSDAAADTLDQWIMWFRDKILTGLGAAHLAIFDAAGKVSPLAASRAIKNIHQAQNLISESSFNVRLVLENLMLKI